MLLARQVLLKLVYLPFELIMIFIFTAVVIALARYKKEWVIKYGIMGVLTIALMHTTVPLMHVLVIDFDAEDFEYQESFTYSGEYVTDLGMDGFITHELIGTQAIGKIRSHITVVNL